jgi:hypothetical protein
MCLLVVCVAIYTRNYRGIVVVEIVVFPWLEYFA